MVKLQQFTSTSSNVSLLMSHEFVHEDAAINWSLTDDGQTMPKNFLFVRVHSSILQSLGCLNL